MPCRVQYLVLPNGRVPVRDFIDGLPKKEQAAVLADITLLRDQGPVLPFPWTSAVRAHRGLRELRTRFGSSQFRIVYASQGGMVLLLHAFKKNSSSRQNNEFDIAAKRLTRNR